ncbi:MAG: ribonuclease HIII [Chlamydiota bacterium]
MNKKPSCFSTSIDLALADKLKAALIAQEFTLSQPPYTLFSGKKTGISCTLYRSGKLTVQGKNKEEFIEFFLEPEILGEFSYTYQDLELDLTPRIGIDESGKGDFFGPLVIAGVYADGAQVEQLHKLGVRDSKSLSPKKILDLAKEIRKICTHHIVKVGPQKYNQLYLKFRNLNSLLGWGHATAIENLVSKASCSKVIIDQFASEHVVKNALKRKNIDVDLTQRHRGESDLVVAAASIIARATFVESLSMLGKQYEIEFPKGASAKTIAAANRFAAKYGKEALAQVAKVHFSTYQKVVL